MAPKYTNAEVAQAVVAGLALIPALLGSLFYLYHVVFSPVQKRVKTCFEILRGVGKKETADDADIELGSARGRGRAWEQHYTRK